MLRSLITCVKRGSLPPSAFALPLTKGQGLGWGGCSRAEAPRPRAFASSRFGERLERGRFRLCVT